MTAPAILTLNAGSSSLKVVLYDADGETVLAGGMVDAIGSAGRLELRDASGGDLRPPGAGPGPLADHSAALTALLAALTEALPGRRIAAVGHRIVHGGPDFAQPVLLNPAILPRLDALCPFAPLHQPHGLAGVRAAMAAFPDAPQIACFDTAFHRSQPFVNDTFGLPRRYYDAGVRRYGFHGLSYDYLTGDLARRWPDLAAGRVILAHLGNGASLCGTRAGRSVASTMGFSPLDGLAMGTRPGQLDPGVVLYLMDQEAMTAAQISDLLYRRSGLLGLSGLSNDMRVLEASDQPAAREAIDYFIARLCREIGGMAAALGGVDALVFSGGIGENARAIRAGVCAAMGWLGLTLAPAANEANGPVISAPGGAVPVLVIPTDEAVVIARAVRRLAFGAR